MSTNKRKSRADPTTKRQQNLNENQQRLNNVREMSQRKILPGRKIDHNVLTTIRSDFARLPWSIFVNLDDMYYPHLIKEFYANFDYTPLGDTTQISFTIGNTDYEYTKAQFGDILGIPHSGVQFYSQAHKLGDIPSSVLTPDQFLEDYCLPNIHIDDIIENGVTGTDLRPPFDLWHIVLNQNVYAKGGNMANVMAAQAVMIHCLESRLPFDMTHFVASRMCGLVSDKKRALPYGVLLTRLFRTLNIQLTQPFKNEQTPLGSETLRKMNRTFSGRTSTSRPSASRPSGSRRSTSRRREPSPDSPEPAELPPLTFNPSEVEFDTMTTDARLSHIYAQNHNLQQETRDLRKETRKLRKENKGLKKMLKSIVAHLGCGSSSPTDESD